MHALHPHKIGLTVAAFLALAHALWALMVFLGVAQSFMDLIFWAHMVGVAYIVKPFELTAALSLVAVVAAMGYIYGYVAALVWNRIHAR